jgi:hypothetical protein
MASSDYLKQYQKAFQKSQSYDVNKFAGDLEKAYNEKTNYNKDLIDQQNNLQAEAQALPGQLRNEYYQSAIRNPLAQEALISGRQAGVRGQIGSVTDLLNARGQQFQDILGKATSAYQTDAQKQQTNAENLWRMYQDAQAQENARRSSGGGAGGGLRDSDGDGIPDILDKYPNDPRNKTATNSQQTAQQSAQSGFVNPKWFEAGQGGVTGNLLDKYLTNTVGKAMVESGVPQSGIRFNPIQNVKTGVNFYSNLLKNIFKR